VPDDQYTATFTRMFVSNITEDTVWGPIDPSIIFDSTVTVASGATLTIEAGSTLKFSSGARLVVNGDLDIRGTLDAPVILTSYRDDEAGGDTNGDGEASSPAANDWGGIDVNSSATANLENVEVRYASKAIDADAQYANVTLRNVVLRNGGNGIYVYSPYAEIDAENVLIADNSSTGVFVRASSAHTFRNCTIVGNGFGGSGWQGAGIHVGAATVNLDNCIVAFNADGLHHAGADESQTIIRNSDFYNPAGQNLIWTAGGPMPQLDQNGNITTDPQFVDRNAGDYEVGPGSPAIDSGRGIQAPSGDILGRARRDDPGMPNVGNGYPSFVDMGAYERQDGTPTADLMVTYVSYADPEIVTAGDTFDLEWTVSNIGAMETIGTWQDLVYLSDNPYLGGDELLATIDHTEPLAAGASHTESVVATVPATSGPKYVLIHTKLEAADQREAVETNNLGVSSRVLAVDVPLLEVGTPIDATAAQGQWAYYRFEGEPGRTVLFSLDGEAGSAELYLRQTLPPTLSNYDVVGNLPGQPDQELRLLEPIAGTYYVGVFTKSLGGGSGSYTLSADLTTLDIYQVTPNQVGNAGTATIKILGDAFDPAAEVQLVAPDATIIEGEEYYQDSATLFATFDLAGAAAVPGAYDVVVTNPGPGSAGAADAVTIFDGGVPGFSASLSMPGVTRPGRVIDCHIDYMNTGSVDIPSPILTLESGVDDTAWRLPGGDRWIEGPDFRVMGLSSDGPPAVLRAGQLEALVVQLRVPLRPERVTVTLSSVGAVPTDGSNGPIDWDSLKEQTRPSWLDNEAWEAVWLNLVDQVGDTWGDYVATLNDNVTHLNLLGDVVYDVSSLFAFEVHQAEGLICPHAILAEVTDASPPAELCCPDPGMLLSFTRIYRQELASRYMLGHLGRGWTHNWEYSVVMDETGNVTVVSPRGPDFFHRLPNGTFTSESCSTLTLEDGQYYFTQPDGRKFVFGDDGRLSYVDDNQGNHITIQYDGDVLAALVHSNGKSYTFEHDAHGRITQVTDCVGEITTYIYDASGEHLVGVTNSNGATNYAYASGIGSAREHALLSIESPDGTCDYFEYDDQGRLSHEFTDASDDSRTYAYDTAGRVTVTDETGTSQILFYNLSGLVRRTITVDQLGRSTEVFLDLASNSLQLRFPGGVTETVQYDSEGNITAFTDALGHRAELQYDPVTNRLVSVRDPRGNTIEYTYDIDGRLTAITYPDGTGPTYAYDDAGNLSETINVRGQAIQYTYSETGQLTGVYYSDGTSDIFTYDANGRILSATDSRGTTTMEYDASGQLIRIEYPSGSFLAYSYDDEGRRIQMTGEDGFTVNYGYGANGRLTGLTDASGETMVLYDYDASGRLARKDMGNGTYTTYDYDAGGQLIHLINYAPDGTVNSRFDYTYDDLGRRTSMTTLEGEWTYGYDNADRLMFVALPGGRLIEYEYDATGNRISSTDGGITTYYTANNLNQYTSAGSATYAYDPDGNLLSRTDEAGTSTYSFNEISQLTETTTSDGTWTYEYDPFGNRVATTYQGELTEYLVDLTGTADVIAEYDGMSSLVARYIHGPFGLVGRVNPAGEITYYDFDALGNAVGITDPMGIYLNEYSYLPFGEILSSTETVANPFEYVGQWGVMGEGNGLAFMRARYYSPGEGRFLSRDPVGVQIQKTNLYAYAENNPISLVDPTGLRDVGAYNPSSDYCSLSPDSMPGIFNFRYSCFLHDTCYNTCDAGKATCDAQFLMSMLASCALSLQPLQCAGFAGVYYTAVALGGGWAYDAGQRNACGEEPDPDDEPDPNDEEQDEDSTDPRTSYTPEDKLGPAGYDLPGTPDGSEVRFIPAGQTMEYRVEFWNREDAPVPTQDAIIMDQLDPDVFDLSTLEFTRIGFLDWDVELPGGQVIDTRIDCRPEMDLAVEVRAGLGMEVPGFANNADITPNTLVWWFHAIDPETGEWPEDPMAGFLPPYNPETGYEIGWIEFTVDPVEGLASGTELANLAYVEFDFAGDIYDHPAPKVDPNVEPADPAPWINTIDAGVPESHVLPLPATSSQAAFLVQWTGQDEENGSGLAGYDIYVSTDGGAYARWLEDITGTSAVFPGDFGHTYVFYSIATDNVGHREPAPLVPDAQITIPPNEDPVANDDFPVMDEDTVATIDVLANDTDDGLLDPTRVRVTYPAGHGSLVVNPDGTITYTPEVNYFGTDSFKYKVKDEHRAESNAATVTITLNAINDPPVITSFPVTPTVINEGGTVSVTGEFTDPDLSDVHTVVINWDDGTSDTLTLDIGDRTFSATHPYQDDGPSGTSWHNYVVNVTVTDDKGASDSAGDTVTVNNVAPTLSDLSLTPEINEGDFGILSGTISDPGTQETFTLEVDWGDGSPIEMFGYPADTTSFSETHQYLDDDPSGTPSDDYSVSVMLRDDDGGTSGGPSLAGPNAFGYQAYEHPFVGIDLVTGDAGVLMVLDGADDAYVALSLAGNTFNFYGTSYSQVLFPNPNGLFTFGTGTYEYSNTDLSFDPDQATVAPLFDDWRTDWGTDDAVLARFDDLDGDAVSDRLVIEWNNVQHYSSSPSGVTFQAILELNTAATPGNIILNYVDLDAGTPAYDNGASATVGIKNATGMGSDPLLVSYNGTHPNIFAGKAILVSTAPVSALTLTVNNVAPAVDAGFNQTVDEGVVVSLDPAAFNDLGTLDTHTATIDWGDGAVESGVVSESPFGPPGSTAGANGTVSGNHVYADNGVYTVTVTVTDDDGGVGTDTLAVMVNNVAPTIVLSGPASIPEGSVYTLTLGPVTDPGADTVNEYIVHWGDGETDTYSIGGDVSHVYADGPASHTIVVDLRDEDGTHPGSGTLDVQVINVSPSIVDATFEIEENSPNATTVGSVIGTDPGDDTLTYSIVGGSGATAFAVDANTGQISVADETQLDYETTASFTLEVQVEDDDTATDTAMVTIDLLNQASITGVVFVDVNENGVYEANEPGINGITVELLDENGAPILDALSNPITAMTSDGGFYLFEDLDPGTYQLSEVQPTGVDDGEEILGSLGGMILANDTMKLTLERIDAANYVFAELGQSVTSGDTATIGFWQNKHGQELIAQGGTALAGWLTDNFENVFGDTFVGADVASFYKDQLFKQKAEKSAGPAKADAQFMAAALATYFTNSNLAGDVAADYGFNVTDTGIGTKIVDVGDKGAAFGVANGTSMTIMQLLWATNELTDQPDNLSDLARIYDLNGDGQIDAYEAALRMLANEVYAAINEQGAL